MAYFTRSGSVFQTFPNWGCNFHFHDFELNKDNLSGSNAVVREQEVIHTHLQTTTFRALKELMAALIRRGQ